MQRLKEAHSDLDAMYYYYLSQVERIMDNAKNGTPNLDDEMGNPKDIYNVMYEYIHDAMVEVKFPNVVKDEEYFLNNGEEVYHGFASVDHMVDFLDNRNRHYGYGACGSGFYMSDDPDDARGYTSTRADGIQSMNRVMKMKVDTSNFINGEYLDVLASYLTMDEDALGGANRIIDIAGDLDNEKKYRLTQLKKFIKEKEKQENKKSYDSEFTSLFTYNTSILALMLGFDGVIPFRPNKSHYIVLNPEVIAVSQSEKNRVMGLQEESVK